METTGSKTAQESRTEVLSAAAPADSKPNSQAVPEVYALTSQFERVLMLRFKHQTDLLSGIEAMVKEHKVGNAVILAAAGSVLGYHTHNPGNGTFPVKNVYVQNPACPADIVSMNGYVINGRVHAHITLTDADKAFGGHLEHGASAFTFAIVTIGVLKEGIDLSRFDDKTYR